jgi:hypothetical protein
MYFKCTISAGAIENNEKSIKNLPAPIASGRRAAKAVFLRSSKDKDADLRGAQDRGTEAYFFYTSESRRAKRDAKDALYTCCSHLPPISVDYGG